MAAGARRVVSGPSRDGDDRRITLVGAALATLLAFAVGAILLALGYFSDPEWQRFGPPLAPFLLLPLPAGLLSGLRFTSDLTQPERLSWRRLLGVSAGVVFVAITSVTLVAFIGYEVQLAATDPSAVNIVSDGLAGTMLALVWVVFPGILLLPFLVPVVAAFAIVVRRLDRRRHGSGPFVLPIERSLG
jgi:hypothetical protein